MNRCKICEDNKVLSHENFCEDCIGETLDKLKTVMTENFTLNEIACIDECIDGYYIKDVLEQDIKRR